MARVRSDAPHPSVPSELWLPRADYRGMTTEADRAAPDETGGVLLGYVTGDAIVVTSVVGPGPQARHAAEAFVPDYEYQEREIARLYEAAGRTLRYLGDWHTHPGAAAYMSRRDRATIGRIARHADARAAAPAMVILGRDAPGARAWAPRAWVTSRRPGRWWSRGIDVVPLTLHVY